MKSRAFIIGGLLSLGLLASTVSAQQPVPAAPAAVKPTPTADVTVLLKQVLDGQRNLENKLADIQKRLDSISQFLGDQRASSFDTVDRRLRDIADDVKDIKR